MLSETIQTTSHLKILEKKGQIPSRRHAGSKPTWKKRARAQYDLASQPELSKESEGKRKQVDRELEDQADNAKKGRKNQLLLTNVSKSLAVAASQHHPQP
jgi:hypothetical protein